MLLPAAVTGLLLGGYALMLLSEAIIAPLPPGIPALLVVGSPESGVLAWWNSTLMLGIAILALLLAALCRPGRPAPERLGRASWLITAAVAGYLSLDESVELSAHLGPPAERMLGGTGGEVTSLFTFAWVFPAAVLAFVGCALAIHWARRLPFDLRVGLLAAIATYVTGALGLETANAWLHRQHVDLAWRFGTVVEEILEMGGCLIGLATLAAGLVLVRDTSGRRTLALRPDLADPRTAVRFAGRSRGVERPASVDPGDTTGTGTSTTPGCATHAPETTEEAALRPDPHDDPG